MNNKPNFYQMPRQDLRQFWKQKAIATCQQGLLEAMKTNPIGAFVVGAIEGWKQ